MVGELYLVGAGVGGLLIGFVVGKIMGGGSNKAPSAFTGKEMRRWNLNEEWANMINEKKAKELAQKALDEIEEAQKITFQERRRLRDRQEKVLQDIREISKRHDAAKNDFEKKAILGGLGDISAEHSTIRRSFDLLSNQLVAFEESKAFLTAVRNNQSVTQIKRTMNKSILDEVIRNNEGMASDIFMSEFKSLSKDSEPMAEAIRPLDD